MKLEEFGFTTTELQERLLEKLADDFWSGKVTDADGVKYDLQKKIEVRIKETVEKIAAEHVLPRVDEFIQTLTLKPTNRWGEPVKDQPCMTFREYLVKCANDWITETVSFDGKSRSEDSYGFRGAQTRLAWMIHQHLQYNINNAVTAALKDLNTKAGQAIAETVKLQISDVMQKLSVKVTT